MGIHQLTKVVPEKKRVLRTEIWALNLGAKRRIKKPKKTERPGECGALESSEKKVSRRKGWSTDQMLFIDQDKGWELLMNLSQVKVVSGTLEQLTLTELIGNWIVGLEKTKRFKVIQVNDFCCKLKFTTLNATCVLEMQSTDFFFFFYDGRNSKMFI